MSTPMETDKAQVPADATSGGVGDKPKASPVPTDAADVKMTAAAAAPQTDAKHKPTPDGGGSAVASASTSTSGDAAPATKKVERSADEWHLSVSLNKFESAVRDIAVGSNNSLVVAEERGRVSVWARQGRTNGFYNKDLFFDKLHDGLAYCVETIWPAGNYPPKAAAANKKPTAAAAATATATAAQPTAMDTGAAAKPKDADASMTPAADSAAPASSSSSVAAAAAGTGSSIMKVVRAPDDGADSGPVSELFITGGGGSNLAKTITSYGKVVNTLAGHTGPVNSISQTADGRVLTGSWDGTVKIWANGQAVGRLATNQQYATEVLGLPSGEIVTGSGNKAINIYRADGSLLKSINNAHEHVVRKLAYHPAGFVSAGNDGHVKLWTTSGETLLDLPTHAYSDQKAQFIYGMCVLATGEFVAAGDDGTVKIWAANGAREVQVIQHPGSVRCVKALPNGDFVTGCADRVLRIFTRSPDRRASDLELEQFDELIRLVQTAGGGAPMKGFDNLPDESALAVPGKKDGEIKVVMTKARGPFVFKWTSATAKWDEVGEALGQKGGGGMGGPRPKVDGKEYDFVTDVFVTDDKSVPLGFNRDDDPDDVVNAFCAMYGLPHDYRDQLLAHIRPKVDLGLVAQRKEAARQAKLAAQFKQTPCWAIGGFQLFAGNVKPAPMKKRFLQHANELAALPAPAASTSTAAAGASEAAAAATAQVGGSHPGALTPSELKTLDGLVATIGDEANYHSAGFPADQRALLARLLATWPADKLLPVLDAYRCLMAHDAACDALAGADPLRELHLSKAGAGAPRTHLLLVLRACANWMAKRKKPELYRRTAPPKDVLDHVLAVLLRFVASEGSSAYGGSAAGAATAWADRPLAEAFVYFAHNVVAWLGRCGVQESELWLVVAAALVDILHALGADKAPAAAAAAANAQQQKTVFFALLTLASIGYGSAPAKKAVGDAYGRDMRAFAVAGLASANLPTKQVSDDLMRVYNLPHN